MVFTDTTLRYFSLIQYKIRSSMTKSKSSVPYEYEGEKFFQAYQCLYDIWINGKSKRQISKLHDTSREKLNKWENNFSQYGVLGLLPKVSNIDIHPQLEKLIILIKAARPHERANYTLNISNALGLEGSSLKLIRRTQKCYGFGQRMNQQDILYYQGLQQIFFSIDKQKKKMNNTHDRKSKRKTFYNYTKDHMQHRIELFKKLSSCKKRRTIRPILKEFGISPNRFYDLKKRYSTYGVWGLIDLVQKGYSGEKISSELELQIIEKRLMNPKLSTKKMIDTLNLKCSKSNVQKIYKKWELSKFKESIKIRGLVSEPYPKTEKLRSNTPPNKSAKTLFPSLIKDSNLKENISFLRILKCLSYKKVSISNPGALLIAPFLDQLGVVEALRTYGPESFCATDITNSIIVNVLRIIAGFPSINNYSTNSDRSVAIGSGLSLNPKKSRFYDSFDDLRFDHLQNLRNDASCRAKELGLFDGKEIAIDYHCDPSDSRYPSDKSLTKSPDKNGNLVYAHRPQIIWDSIANTIINIAYCEGRSRAPTALYKFCEDNLFKIIDQEVVKEIYADSEYTGEKQFVYLSVRSSTDITMCLKQNPKIKKWREEVVKENKWEDYGKEYRISSRDFQLAETGKLLRFIVKQNKETEVIRCFGSTHIDYSPKKILDSYHIRWPVETGIKDLIENYFLNKPTGTSPEKVETHYYCVMLARLSVDYFRSVLNIPGWKTPENWDCVLSTIRNTLFSNQNCELSINDDGDFLLTYLDGDAQKVKKQVANMLKKWKEIGLNKVSWWGNRGVLIEIKDQFNF